MILLGDLAVWAHITAPDGLGLDGSVPVLSIENLDDAGVIGQALFIGPTGGPGYLLEGALDVPTFQFRMKGAQGNPGEAFTAGEAFAKQVDDLMFVASNYPTTIGGRHVTKIGRIGGPPAFLLTRDRQTHFTASYSFEIATL